MNVCIGLIQAIKKKKKQVKRIVSIWDFETRNFLDRKA